MYYNSRMKAGRIRIIDENLFEYWQHILNKYHDFVVDMFPEIQRKWINLHTLGKRWNMVDLF